MFELKQDNFSLAIRASDFFDSLGRRIHKMLRIYTSNAGLQINTSLDASVYLRIYTSEAGLQINTSLDASVYLRMGGEK